MLLTVAGDHARLPAQSGPHRSRYGPAHRKLRAILLAQWAAGLIMNCWRCGQVLDGPPSRIHLGHTDDSTAYAGLEHGRCNESAAAVKSNRERRPQALTPRQLRAIRRKTRPPRAW